eukprot:scaffold292473_cov17-Prasinocladus_malaysianus.AAC.1
MDMGGFMHGAALSFVGYACLAGNRSCQMPAQRPVSQSPQVEQVMRDEELGCTFSDGPDGSVWTLPVGLFTPDIIEILTSSDEGAT